MWIDVLGAVTSAIAERPATIMGLMASPITGADGNVEFVLHARPGRAARSDPTGDDVQLLIDQAVAEAVDHGRGRT